LKIFLKKPLPFERTTDAPHIHTQTRPSTAISSSEACRQNTPHASWTYKLRAHMQLPMPPLPQRRYYASMSKKRKRSISSPVLSSTDTFCPAFVCSTDGMLGLEAQQLLKRIAGKLTILWQATYSQVCGYVNACTSIAIASTTCHTPMILRGSRVPTKHISTRWSQWDDGACLGLF
jgi:hypothetical protein